MSLVLSIFFSLKAIYLVAGLVIMFYLLLFRNRK
jgi:hypothetical protein